MKEKIINFEKNENFNRENFIKICEYYFVFILEQICGVDGKNELSIIKDKEIENVINIK